MLRVTLPVSHRSFEVTSATLRTGEVWSDAGVVLARWNGQCWEDADGVKNGCVEFEQCVAVEARRVDAQLVVPGSFPHIRLLNRLLMLSEETRDSVIYDPASRQWSVVNDERVWDEVVLKPAHEVADGPLT